MNKSQNDSRNRFKAKAAEIFSCNLCLILSRSSSLAPEYCQQTKYDIYTS